MNDYEINDSRSVNEFKNITFSKFARSKVKKELLSSLYNNNLEPSCYWSIELICAGHFSDLWDILLLYTSRYIHQGNPKLPMYIDIRFKNFKTIISNGYIGNELALRNNIKIRKLFAELIAVLCNSKKKHAFESFAIKDKNDFDITNLTTRLKAPNINFAENIFYNNDPKEIFIAINEFAYHISKSSKDITSACYWFEWIIQFEQICKNKKVKCECERRTLVPVEEKFQMNIIWIIWTALINESKKKSNILYNKAIIALLNLYCIKYTPGSTRKRKYIIYSAISFLTENINFNIPLIENKQIIDIVLNKINIIYKDVKKNEIIPKTEYLFNGLERSNLDKTVDKLNILDNMNIKNIIIPSK